MWETCLVRVECLCSIVHYWQHSYSIQCNDYLANSDCICWGGPPCLTNNSAIVGSHHCLHHPTTSPNPKPSLSTPPPPPASERVSQMPISHCVKGSTTVIFVLIDRQKLPQSPQRLIQCWTQHPIQGHDSDADADVEPHEEEGHHNTR